MTKRWKSYIILFGICLLLQVLKNVLISDSQLVASIYSTGFYIGVNAVARVLFSWIPFSFGDLFYLFLGGMIVYFTGKAFVSLFRRQWSAALTMCLNLGFAIWFLYHLFYFSWGMNYYRTPLAIEYNIDQIEITEDDFYQTLDSILMRANQLRQEISIDSLDRKKAKLELVDLMRADTIFHKMLVYNNVKAKEPISSELISYFTVTGYFNPFTHEANINTIVPIISSPFTTVHELSHQMGIGFEDECNFIAFEKLRSHHNIWFSYSAHYEALQAMLNSLYYADKNKFELYLTKISPLIKRDIENERLFWGNYRGWIDQISGLFYNQYLQHNNQPEGVKRYNMMVELILKWDKKNRALR